MKPDKLKCVTWWNSEVMSQLSNLKKKTSNTKTCVRLSLNWNMFNVNDLQGSAGGRCTVTSMHNVHMLQKNHIISPFIRSSSPRKVKQTLQHLVYTAFKRAHATSVHTIPLWSSPVKHCSIMRVAPQKHTAQWVKHGAVCGTDLGQWQQQVIHVMCVFICVEVHTRWLEFTTCGNEQKGVIRHNVTTE